MKTRKLLSFLLAVLILLSTLTIGMTVEATLPFNDVSGHWGEAAIGYVVEKGLMNGIGDGTSFAPDMSLTRGMVVTVLYRDNGSPKAEFKGTFLDVEEGKYYTAAAEWAYENRIVTGTGTNDWGEPYFSADRDITRQELATMFKRYADFRHVDTSKGSSDISSFPDAGSVADWATDAVKWAVGVGLITGKTGGGTPTLSPADKAMRAEFATIIKRFKEAKFEYFVAYEKPEIMSKYTEPEYPLVTDADIYVAVDGNDKNDGSINSPLATFEAAKARVRELKKTAKDEIVVAFKAGDYGILDNIQFTSDDSGTEKVPVTYCAYGDGDVYFTNGVFISENEFKSLDDSDKEFFNVEFADKIKKVELNGHPVADKIDTGLSLSNTDGLLWPARVPNKRDGIDTYYPGFTKNVALEDSPYTMDELIDSYVKDTMHPDEISTYIDHYKLDVKSILKDKLASYKSLEGVQIIGYITKVWHQDTHDIKSYDKELGRLTFYNPPTYSIYAEIANSTKAYINNVPEELDDKGEFWFDKNTKTIYVYNPKGDHFIATHGTFISGDRANHLNFVGLNFRCTKSEPVVLSQCDNVTFDRTDVLYVSGNGGFEVYECLNFTLKNSEFGYFTGYGIYFKGPGIGDREDYDFMTLESQNILIDNNLFHDVATVDIHSDVAAIKLSAEITGAKISHNEVYNSPRHAISFGKSVGDVLIEYNVFHNCMTNSADGGVIHNGRGLIEPLNVIRYNVFYDIKSTLSGGTFGIYLDDHENDNEIYGNIFYNVLGGILTNNGRSNSIHDNVMIKSGTVNIRVASYALIGQHNDPSSEYGNQLINILPREGSLYYDIWRERTPGVYSLNFDPNYNGPNSAFVPNNTVVDNYSFNAEFSFEDEFLRVGTCKNNVTYQLTENPLFENPAIGDYSIKEGAPIADNHFAEIGRY